MKKWTIIYTLMLSFSCGVALCMENDVHVIDPHGVVFDVFLKNQNKRLSHEIIYALAAVNQSCKKFLLDTAPERSEYLLREIEQHIALVKKPYFNKYGSLVLYKWETKALTKLLISEFFLADDKVKKSYGTWDNFSSCVASLPQPFLNPQGDLCCYGWGKDGDLMLWGNNQHLIQYCLLPDGKSEFFRCGVEIAPNWNYALSHFAALPHLLRAFVNCPVIKRNSLLDTMRIVLKDAIIPDNYAEYQDCGDTGFNIKFDDLEEALKDAIVKRYEECKKLIPQPT